MESIVLLKRIVEKGGLMGTCGKNYKNDEILADQFLHECYDYCKHPMALNLWGETLTKEIKEYVLKKKKKNRSG